VDKPVDKNSQNETKRNGEKFGGIRDTKHYEIPSP
jgi:hypothetical protein